MVDVESLLHPSAKGTRQVFFAGKGGVGKTTIACLTALHMARQGYRTLLLTTDPAAHTGSVLGRKVTEQVEPVDGISGLSAAKIDQKQATEDYKKTILDDARTKFGEDTIRTMTEDLASPCTEEMAAFQRFIDLSNTPGFDVIVFDTAPTGHTLRLLELPLEWSEQIRLKTGATEAMSAGDRQQKDRFDRTLRAMRDPELTTFSFVMYPESTPILEAQRASQELAAIGVATQLVVANLLIAEEQATTPFFQKRREMQLGYLDDMKRRFAGAALLQVPMMDSDIRGIDKLDTLDKIVFGGIA
ncbi:ArsA family ATPase [Candidatus Cryosericum odellii]|jgi:arsenite-transporting ATPase|uniref:arsenite-transporting ATPase n=1 Tax=Candidatus Cryosericum odellii TaxID=2290917 RepID=A0A398DNS8_9BACT|nr:ArsA family ATPase [Candidatus Cryosericum odellii]RIE12914.1 arsenic-transporting ATPase [Candidatus Cryosericum odellii]